jgi:rhodanese-related sulfurtransferase/rubredoxin
MTDLAATLPKEKQTVLGLYVTAKEAHEKWKAAPDKVKILDVRTPEEFLFVGSPDMAWKIPAFAQSYEWDATKGQFPMKLLPDFVSRVQTVAKPDETLMVTCRSGGRSAIACNLLAKAGFKNVFNIIDGMEGDGNGDSESECRGGWKIRVVPGPRNSLPTEWCCPRCSSPNQFKNSNNA